MPRLCILAMDMKKVTYNSQAGTSLFYFCYALAFTGHPTTGFSSGFLPAPSQLSHMALYLLDLHIQTFSPSPYQVNMMVWRLSLLATTVLSSLTLWGTLCSTLPCITGKQLDELAQSADETKDINVVTTLDLINCSFSLYCVFYYIALQLSESHPYMNAGATLPVNPDSYGR